MNYWLQIAINMAFGRNKGSGNKRKSEIEGTKVQMSAKRRLKISEVGHQSVPKDAITSSGKQNLDSTEKAAVITRSGRKVKAKNLDTDIQVSGKKIPGIKKGVKTNPPVVKRQGQRSWQLCLDLP